MDNFIMDVQGSGYIDFGDGVRLTFSAMQGKTVMPIAASVGVDRPWRSEKRRYVDAGDSYWGETHSEAEVRELLEQNPSSFSLNRNLLHR